MKSIARITQQLISLFLVMVASSMMFLSSPAIAATSSLVTVTDENLKTEVINSSKPVIMILASDSNWSCRQLSNYLEETKGQAEKIFGDNYKIVTGIVEENALAYKYISNPYQFPTAFLASVNGQLTPGMSLESVNFTQAFESIKKILESEEKLKQLLKYSKELSF